MTILPQRRIGTTPVEVTEFGFGGTGLGNIYTVVSEDDALSTIRAALAAGIRYFDTAPLYGHGLSELRTGTAIRLARPERVTISTKVGWKLTPSRQDVELTTRLREVGELCGIPVLDHVVVGWDGYVSLAERNWR